MILRRVIAHFRKQEWTASEPSNASQKRRLRRAGEPGGPMTNAYRHGQAARTSTVCAEVAHGV